MRRHLKSIAISIAICMFGVVSFGAGMFVGNTNLLTPSIVRTSSQLAQFDTFWQTWDLVQKDFVSNPVIITMASVATPQFVVNVDEADLGNIKLGQDATIALQSYAGMHLPAKVVAIAPSGTSTGNVITFKVTLDFVTSANQPNILLGMSGTSQVTTAIIIPTSLPSS